MSVRNGVGADPLQIALPMRRRADWGRERLSRRRRAAGRFGTKRSPDIEPDCHWNSCVPHLLAVAARADYRTIGAQAGIQNPRMSGIRTPLVRVSALHGVSAQPGSHLGSTLNPGGAVLTLGVSRRSGSVAYIRVDASPNEVLTLSMMHEHSARVNSPRRLLLTSRYGSVTRPAV